MRASAHRIQQASKTRVRRLFQRFGIDIVRYSPANSAQLRRLRVLEREEITVVIDAGAMVGDFGRALRESGYRGRIVSFEPLAAPFRELERVAATDDLWDVRRQALGEEAATLAMNVAGNVASSSFLPMRDRHVAAAPGSGYVGTEDVEVIRLDSVASDVVSERDRVYLKLDVQGYELAALRGAAGIMARVRAVEAEVSLVPLYEDQPLLAQMTTELDALGFEPVSFAPAYADPETGYLLQLDAIFVRAHP